MDAPSRDLPPHPRAVLGRTAGVVGAYLAYVAGVAALPTRRAPDLPDAEYAAGRAVWLRNQCQACHSLYGLGGHTGPDLTDIATTLPEAALAAVVRTGKPGMPAFELDDDGLAHLHAFLRAVDAGGEYPPKSAVDRVFGSAER